MPSKQTNRIKSLTQPSPATATHPSAAEIENAAATLATVLESLGISLPRGTRPDLEKVAKAAAAAASAPPRPEAPPLAARIEDALRSGAWSLDELARHVRAPNGPVANELKKHRSARPARVYNLGTEDRPRWTWIVGPDATIEELCDACLRILTRVALERDEILAATGVSSDRLGGALRRIQRLGLGRVLDVGPKAGASEKHRARWIILPPNAQPMVVNHGDGQAHSSAAAAAVELD